MTKYVPYIVIAVLLVSLFVSLTNRKEVVIEKIASDTVYIVKLDTIKVKIPTLITKTITDTLYLENGENGFTPIEISQKYYKDSLYEAWVSGFRTKLDSINVFSKTTEKVITNTVTKEIYVKKTDLFVNTGVDYLDNQFVPKIGLSVKFRNDLMLGGEVGIYNKKPVYGIRLGYKINK